MKAGQPKIQVPAPGAHRGGDVGVRANPFREMLREVRAMCEKPMLRFADFIE
jgi:hypothetical protein